MEERIDKSEYQDLKEQYEELELEYRQRKYEIIDAKRDELADLKEDYKYRKYSIEKPLKAEKYRLRMEIKKQNRKLNEAPKRRLLEEIGNSVSHGVGALVGITFLVLTVIKAQTPLALTAAIIYGSCFFLQMLFSCLYHSFRAGTTVKRIFRRFDYASIYLMIGGTFAPLYLIWMIDSMWGFVPGLIFFIVQWTLIVIGITFVGVFGPGRLRPLHFALYFCIGWSGLIFLPSWFKDNMPLLFCILGGGIIYTLGMIPFAVLKKKPVAHFIFHMVVLLASICMGMGILFFVF